MAGKRFYSIEAEVRPKNDKILTDQPPSENGPVVDMCSLVTDYHARVYGFAFRLTGQQADAEDVTQQTFLMAQRNLHQLRQPENPAPWLFAIARSVWLKSHRRQRPVAAGAIELDVNQVAAELPDDDIDREQLQLALDELADEFKLPLVMFYFEQRSYKEIAAELEMPIGTVMSRLARAKSQLRKLLAPADETQVPNNEDSAVTTA